MKARMKPAPHAKLTADQVLEIRRLGDRQPHTRIARSFGITNGLVSQIVNGRAWKWLKTAAQVIALLIVAAGRAGADVYEYPTTPDPQPTLMDIMSSCDISVAAFLAANMHPKTECHYPLSNVFVFQKVKGGYLLAGDFWHGGDAGLIFLKTRAPLTRGTTFNNEPVKLMGTYKYEGIDGFDKEVWAFDVVMPKDQR